MKELINLDRIHKSAHEIIEPYTKELLDILGDNICSVAVYGSGVGQEFIPGKSNINLLVVCKEVRISELKKCFKLILRGRKKGIVTPLFLTKVHMESSSDVFPIEFLELADFHQIIYGEDIFIDLKIDKENLRLECEEQLKGKLIRLRETYLEVGAEYKSVKKLLSESITSLVPVFRGMLRLKNMPAPFAKSEVINLVSEEFGIGREIFLKALDVKTGRVKLETNEVEEVFEKYLDEIEKLGIMVDKLGKSGLS